MARYRADFSDVKGAPVRTVRFGDARLCGVDASECRERFHELAMDRSPVTLLILDGLTQRRFGRSEQK